MMSDQQALIGVGADVLLALLSHSSITSNIREAAVIDALEHATISCQRYDDAEDEGEGEVSQPPHAELVEEVAVNNKLTSGTRRHTLTLIPQMIRSLLSSATPPSARAISAMINWASAASSPLTLIAIASNVLLNSSLETIPVAALNNAADSIEKNVTQSIQMLHNSNTGTPNTCVSLSELIAGLALRNNGVDSTPINATIAAAAATLKNNHFRIAQTGPTNVSIEPSTSLGIFGGLECASGDTALSPLSPRRGIARIWNRDSSGEVTEAITSLFSARVKGKLLPNAATLRLLNSESTYSGDGGAVTLPLNIPFRATVSGGGGGVGNEIIPKFSFFSFSVTVDDSSWKPRDAVHGNSGVTSEAINVIPVCLTISSGGMELWRSGSLHLPGDTTHARVCVASLLTLTIGIEPFEKVNQLSGVVFPFLVFPQAVFESAIPGQFRAPRIFSYSDATIIPFESGYQFLRPSFLAATSIKNDKISASLAAPFLLSLLSWLAELDAESARQNVLVTPSLTTQRLGSLGGHSVISGGSDGLTISQSIAAGAGQKKVAATTSAVDGGIKAKDDILFVRARNTADSVIYRAKMALPATRAVAQTLARLVQTTLAATIAESVRQTSPILESGSNINNNSSSAVDLRPCMESIDANRDITHAESLTPDTLRSVIILSHSLFVRAAAIGIGKVDSNGHNKCSCGVSTSIDITGEDFDAVIVSGIDAERLVKPSACCFNTLRESLVAVAAAGTGVDAIPALRTLRVLAASALDAAFSLTARDAGARRGALTESLSGGATLLFHLPALPPTSPLSSNTIPPHSSPALSPTDASISSTTTSASPQVTPARRGGLRSSMRSSRSSRNIGSSASASPTTPSITLSPAAPRMILSSNLSNNNNHDVKTQQIADFALYIQLEAQRAGFETEINDVGGGSGIVQMRVVLPPTRTRAAVRFIENGVARAISRAGLGEWCLPRGSALVPLFVERFDGAKGFTAVAGVKVAIRLCLAVGNMYDYKEVEL
jgi:hypothetical protein